MKSYKYIVIFLFIISCSSNNTVYWCGDHPCANNKEKEIYFKKTMIVEVKNLNKKDKKKTSDIEKILNQAEFKSERKKIINNDTEINEQIELDEAGIKKEENELAEQLKIDEERRKKEEKELAEQLRLEEKQKLKEKKEIKKITEIKEDEISIEEKTEHQASSSIKKVVLINEDHSKNFDELVENILARNSSRSYPKINDIPK